MQQLSLDIHHPGWMNSRKKKAVGGGEKISGNESCRSPPDGDPDECLLFSTRKAAAPPAENATLPVGLFPSSSPPLVPRCSAPQGWGWVCAIYTASGYEGGSDVFDHAVGARATSDRDKKQHVRWICHPPGEKNIRG